MSMYLSPKKSDSQRGRMPIDDLLDKAGYQRKRSPRDPTCLFRAFAEQIYLTQRYHIRVREECVQFMKKNTEFFQQRVRAPFETYLEEMSYFTEYGGPNEIFAMSLLYQREIFLFDGLRMQAQAITDNGFEETIYLCLSLPKHYESVYPKGALASIGFCQSIVYQTLYEDVFKMSNLEETVRQMLYDNSNNLRHDKFFATGNLETREQLTNELLSKVEKGNETKGRKAKENEMKVLPKPPFPYRVAKALDPNIFRNIDLDVWNELRREVKNAGWSRWSPTELQVGGKCLVQFDTKEENSADQANNNSASRNTGKEKNSSRNGKTSGKRDSSLYYGHIQQMSKNEGPVVVFIEELGEKRTVPYSSLRPMPSLNLFNNENMNNISYKSTENRKKTWTSSHRSKEITKSTKTRVDTNNNSNRKLEKTKSTSEKLDNDDTAKKTIIENYTSYRSFSIQNTIDVRPVTVVYENWPNYQPPQNSEETENVPEVSNSSNLENQVARASPNVASLPPESIVQPLQQVSLTTVNEPFYPNQAVVPSQNYPGSVNPCPPSDTLDRRPRGVNFSAPVSVDANGSDLPFSDTITLRFFYNLGLHVFRSGALGVEPIDNSGMMQAVDAPVPQQNFVPDESNQEPQTPENEMNWRRKQKPQRNFRNEQPTVRYQAKGFNRRNEPRQNFECPGRNERRWTPPVQVEPQRSQTYERTNKDQNHRKNNQPMKNRTDTRNRNFNQGQEHQGRNYEFRQTENFNQETKRNYETAEATAQQVQPAYASRQINGLTFFYPCDSNGFYPQYANFYPLPYSPSPELIEPGPGNAINQPPPAVFPILNENYVQPMHTVYPPYVIPQMYHGIPTHPNHQEWHGQAPFAPQDSSGQSHSP